jgi:flagellar motor switch protein FliM
MPEILTQSQIDALLKGLDSGEVSIDPEPKRRIREYDFRSPMKFTKEQLKALDNLHETLSRLLSSYFLGILRLSCDMEVFQIEEQRYFEFNNALPDSALIGVLELTPTDPNLEDITMLIDVSPQIGYLLVDRLLGGSGKGYAIARDFTDIEVAILRSVFEKISGYVEESWKDYVEVKASVTSIETNARLVQIYSPEEIVVIVLMRVRIRDITGTISICIPAANLEEFIVRFSSKYVRASKKTDAEKEVLRKQIILRTITNSELEIKAVLGEMQLDLQDILQLQVNDVIPLHINTDKGVCVNVENEPWFEAKLGQTKLKKAIMIDSLLQREGKVW